jgi:hypothetical protein
MVKNTKKRFKESYILSASEIGQYFYCSIAWYLQKCGYKSKSPSLEIGKKKHEEIGRVMYHVQIKTKRLRFFSIVGYILFIVAVLIILYGVIF